MILNISDTEHIMQTLNLGGQGILIFFDSRVNTHLVDREMAKSEGFWVIDPSYSHIALVGRGNLQLHPGPVPDGDFHELEAQGLVSSPCIV